MLTYGEGIMKQNPYFQDFLTGFESIYNLFPESLDFSFHENKTNEEKLRGDWENVGKDMYKAMEICQNGSHIKTANNHAK